MSQPIYEIYSYFLGIATEQTTWLYSLEPSAYVEQYQIPIHVAKIIANCCNDQVLSEPKVIAGLLTIAYTNKATSEFWEHFRPSPTYIFVEFAKNNFFPLTYIFEGVIDQGRQAYIDILNNTRIFEKLYPFIGNNAQQYSESFEYIASRERGTPTRLANLAIAAQIIPDGIFDWDSCRRGDEREYLMMFGIQELEPFVFNEWTKLYEEYGDY